MALIAVLILLSTVSLLTKSTSIVVLDSFVSYLRGNGETSKLSPNTISLYIAAVRSYLAYYDIHIGPAKFKRRVKLPKNPREDEQPIDGEDIRRILLSCNNQEIKGLPVSDCKRGVSCNGSLGYSLW